MFLYLCAVGRALHCLAVQKAILDHLNSAQAPLQAKQSYLEVSVGPWTLSYPALCSLS